MHVIELYISAARIKSLNNIVDICSWQTLNWTTIEHLNKTLSIRETIIVGFCHKEKHLDTILVLLLRWAYFLSFLLQMFWQNDEY